MGLFSSIGKAVKKAVGTVSNFIPGVGGVIGSVGSSLLGNLPSIATGAMHAYGSAQQQQLAIEEAQRQRAWSSAEAEKNRWWQHGQAQNQMNYQTVMSNSAHQRQMNDLRKAGLNPILAARGGASSPGGAMGGGAMPTGGIAQTIDKIGPALHSAMQAKGLQSTLKTAQRQRSLMAEQENSAHAQGVIDLQRMSERTAVDMEHARVRDINAQARQRELDHARGEAEHKFYQTLGPAAKFAALAGGGAATAMGIKKLFESFRDETPNQSKRRRRR